MTNGQKLWDRKVAVMAVPDKVPLTPDGALDMTAILDAIAAALPPADAAIGWTEDEARAVLDERGIPTRQRMRLRVSAYEKLRVALERGWCSPAEDAAQPPAPADEVDIAAEREKHDRGDMFDYTVTTSRYLRALDELERTREQRDAARRAADEAEATAQMRRGQLLSARTRAEQAERERDGAQNARDLWRDNCEHARNERDEARRFGEDAARRYNALLEQGPTLTCAFCGYEYASGTPASRHEALTEHVMECEKHPLRARAEQAEAKLAALEHPDTCEYCGGDAAAERTRTEALARDVLRYAYGMHPDGQDLAAVVESHFADDPAARARVLGESENTDD